MLNFSYQDTARVEQKRAEEIASSTEEYREHLQDVMEDRGYSEWEGTINLPVDEELLAQVNAAIEQKKSENLRYIIVAGIGGSNLGTKAVYDAMRGFYSEEEPRIIFTDTVSPPLLARAKEIIQNTEDPGEVVVNVVTKSGSTTETIANAEFLIEALKEKYGEESLDRVVATTDEGSALWNSAQEQGITVLPVPEKVGGRFSVLSAVGLFPLGLAGIDIGALLQGAADMRGSIGVDSMEDNPSLASAVLTCAHRRDGIRINNTFLFNPELESIGKWYRQLMGESIGKEKDSEGKVVHEGITPIVTIGSTDLHSMAQLYFGGPRDKFTTFVYAPRGEGAGVPADLQFPGLVEDIAGRSHRELMEAIYQGVKRTYANNELPYVEVDLESVNEYELGQYLQFKMGEMMYLGYLLNVNAFIQPNVEEYKDETRRILSQES